MVPPPEILFLTYHKVTPRFEWGLTTVSPLRFERQIEYLYDAGYRSIRLTDLISGEPQPGKPLALLFDDAYECVYQYVFPILRKFGFQATVFVITGFVGEENKWDANLGGIRFRHMNWSQLQELKKFGWEIGSHTVSHRSLTLLSEEHLNYEITASKDQIEKNIGTKVLSFSFPFSHRNPLLDEVVYQGGYRIEVSLRPFWEKHPLLCQVSSHPVYKFDGINNLRAKHQNRTDEVLKERLISYGSIATVWEKQLVGKGLEIRAKFL